MAQHVDVIMTRLNGFVDKQLTSLSQSNPLMAFAKPLITRVIDNNSYKVEAMLKQIADKDGMVDVNGILSEMIDNVINTKPFKVNSGFLGELEIGSGKNKDEFTTRKSSVSFKSSRFNWIKRYAKSIDREEWQKCHSFSVYIQ